LVGCELQTRIVKPAERKKTQGARFTGKRELVKFPMMILARRGVVLG
jgi:hypothetical protein